jgi:acyl-CoA reductase-like NAD-dependent aldehyde dehydrogenase
MVQNVLLHINGAWRPAAAGKTLDVINPATEEVIAKLSCAGTDDLDEALAKSPPMSARKSCARRPNSSANGKPTSPG